MNGFKNNKVHNELPPIKKNYKQSNNNDKENENKNQLFSIQTHFFERDKNNNMNFLYKKKLTPRNKVIKKSEQNSIRRQKIEIDIIENNNKPDNSINNFSKTHDSFYKQNKRYEFGGFEGINFNYNTNQNNNYESQFDYKKFKNKETKNENFINKNIDAEQHKLMNNFKEKEKNLEFNLNNDKSIKIKKQLKEIKELKKGNEQYKPIIKEKDNEINNLKQGNERYIY